VLLLQVWINYRCLANNLLARNALAKKPIEQCRIRSVFDFSYPGNLYLSQYSDPIADSLSGSGTPLLDLLDPLTHGDSTCNDATGFTVAGMGGYQQK